MDFFFSVRGVSVQVSGRGKWCTFHLLIIITTLTLCPSNRQVEQDPNRDLMILQIIAFGAKEQPKDKPPLIVISVHSLLMSTVNTFKDFWSGCTSFHSSNLKLCPEFRSCFKWEWNRHHGPDAFYTLCRNKNQCSPKTATDSSWLSRSNREDVESSITSPCSPRRWGSSLLSRWWSVEPQLCPRAESIILTGWVAVCCHNFNRVVYLMCSRVLALSYIWTKNWGHYSQQPLFKML